MNNEDKTVPGALPKWVGVVLILLAAMSSTQILFGGQKDRVQDRTTQTIVIDTKSDREAAIRFLEALLRAETDPAKRAAISAYLEYLLEHQPRTSPPAPTSLLPTGTSLPATSPTYPAPVHTTAGVPQTVGTSQGPSATATGPGTGNATRPTPSMSRPPTNRPPTRTPRPTPTPTGSAPEPSQPGLDTCEIINILPFCVRVSGEAMIMYITPPLDS